jgi:hypothetical protein
VTISRDGPVIATWYRYSNFRYAGGINECGDPIPGTSSAAVRLHKIDVLKFTPKGAWVRDYYTGDPRFVRITDGKQYAHATKEEARQSFIARKRRQITILSARLDDAREALRIAQQGAMEEEHRTWQLEPLSFAINPGMSLKPSTR